MKKQELVNEIDMYNAFIRNSHINEETKLSKLEKFIQKIPLTNEFKNLQKEELKIFNEICDYHDFLKEKYGKRRISQIKVPWSKKQRALLLLRKCYIVQKINKLPDLCLEEVEFISDVLFEIKMIPEELVDLLKISYTNGWIKSSRDGDNYNFINKKLY